MGWQDDLNSLEADLSAGRIRVEEYRRRRDDLLAAASSNPPRGRVPERRQPPIVNANDPRLDVSPVEVTQQINPDSWVAKPGSMIIDQSPVAADPPAPAPMQGAEVFGLQTAAASPNGRGWLRFVVAIVILGVIAAMIWFFAFNKNSGEPAAGANGEFTLEKLPNPTDSPLTTAGVLTVDQAQVYNLIRPDEAAYLAAAGTQKIFYRQITSGTVSTQIFYFQLAPGTPGGPLAKQVVDRGAKLGMQNVPDLPNGTTGIEALSATSGILEAIYPTDRGAVRIVVGQLAPPEEKALISTLKKTVTSVQGSLPNR
ncbi:hypothetical protein [Actinocrispum sp. NPDC049592]|uniref:hypothetical protein n=1 Tax=Actinocrispum sp. NPDC049592 TaxID=3154835 RepID=UPI003436A992